MGVTNSVNFVWWFPREPYIIVACRPQLAADKNMVEDLAHICKASALLVKSTLQKLTPDSRTLQ